MTELTNPQIRKLKAAAQHLEPVVRIGKAGLSDALIESVNEALTIHELIKVRFEDFKSERKTLAPVLAGKTSSALVMQVGHVVALYRAQPDPAKRRVLT